MADNVAGDGSSGGAVGDQNPGFAGKILIFKFNYFLFVNGLRN